MARAGFEKQLRRVFTFITGLTVLVGAIAILSNRYLVENHRALIQNNLPAAALTRTIQSDSTYIATLATAFTEVGNLGDLDALTDDLLTRVEALRAAVGELAALAPNYADPAGFSLADLDEAVRMQADLARLRLAARGAVAAATAATAATLSALEDIVARQTDTARVQVTASIADLYEAAPEAVPGQLDRLADVNFFTYDRLYELSRAVEASRTALAQVDRASTSQAVTALAAAFEGHLADARGRLAYLPSASARSEAAAQLASLATELSPSGIFAAQSRAIETGARLAVALDGLGLRTAALLEAADALLARMQGETTANQARTEQLAGWITFGLIAFLGSAITAAAMIWAMVSRRTVSRLAAVSQHIAALARGEYDRPIPETGSDEIGQMERALHVLRLRAAEARRLRDQLEEAVTQRTRDVVTEMHAHDRARAEAEAANRAKSEFLATMGHEIRTPLNGVVGMLRLLETDGADGAQRERATIARQSAENLLTLSNDILDYAATQERRPVLSPVHFDPRELMAQLAGYLRANAAEKTLATAIDMAPGMPAALFGDLQKIRQILVNLLSNAVKYTRAGRVTLFLDHAVQPETGWQVLSFAVTDTGIGIDPADHARIFDAYARGSRHAGEAIEGLGLGLSISRRLTEALGGAISVQSAPGAGSCFTFSLALPQGDAALITRQGEALGPANLGRRVLVVEDHVVNRMVARGYLHRMGCEVVEAETGAEGVALALAGGFDLVLMDLDLPDMSGGEAAAAISAASSQPPLIAALTAHHIADDPETRTALHVARILHKPLSPRMLADLLGVTAAPADRLAPLPDDATRAILASDIADIGPAETAAIVEMFLDRLTPALAAMQAAQAAGDMGALAKHAHRLKGAASNFALNALCDQMGRIEAAAKIERGVPAAVRGLQDCAASAATTLRGAARAAGLQIAEGSTSR